MLARDAIVYSNLNPLPYVGLMKYAAGHIALHISTKHVCTPHVVTGSCVGEPETWLEVKQLKQISGSCLGSGS